MLGELFADAALTSSSSMTQDSLKRGPSTMRLAMRSLFSLCSGLLQRSMVLAVSLEASEHQDSHQSQSWGREWMGMEFWA